jgi:hypothetical protein
MKRLLFVAALVVVFAGTASAFSYSQWSWQSYRYDATAGIFWDDLDLWTHNMTNTLHDPGALLDVDGYRIYTQMSNLVDHMDNQFGGEATYGGYADEWAWGASGDLFDFGKFGFIYVRDGYKDAVDMSGSWTGYVDTSGTGIYRAAYDSSGTLTHEANTVENDFNFTFAHMFNELAFGIAIDRVHSTTDITGAEVYAYDEFNAFGANENYYGYDYTSSVEGQEGYSDIEVTVSGWYPLSDNFSGGIQFGYESWKEMSDSTWSSTDVEDNNIGDFFGNYEDSYISNESSLYEAGASGSGFGVGVSGVYGYRPNHDIFFEFSYLSRSGNYEDAALYLETDDYAHTTSDSMMDGLGDFVVYDFVDYEYDYVDDAALTGEVKDNSMHFIVYNNVELVDDVRFGVGLGYNSYTNTDDRVYAYDAVDVDIDRVLLDTLGQFAVSTVTDGYTYDVIDNYEYKSTGLVIPVGLEFPLHERFTMRLGARNYASWSEVTTDSSWTFVTGYTTTDYSEPGFDTTWTTYDGFYENFTGVSVDKYKSFNTSYYYGARYDVSENLYIDLGGFADENLLDLDLWNLSVVLKF